MKTGYHDAVISDQGIPIAATITIYLAGTTDLAAIWTDIDGSVIKANPFDTDSYGRFQFFATCGYYDVQVSGAGITTYKIEDVFIGGAFDPGDIVCDEGDIVA